MSSVSVILATAAGVIASVLAPSPSPSSNNGIISQLAEEIRDNYVFPEIGQRTADYLLKQMNDGEYDGLEEQELGGRVTQDLWSFTHDLHFGFRLVPEGMRPRTDENIDQLVDPRRNTTPNGFMRVERLDGNIGYLELSGFMELESARDNADAAMQLLHGSSAVIIDLRKNGGGHPGTVQHLTSYLFAPDEPVHLNSLYFRPTDETTEFWTYNEIDTENAMPEVPVYVLTSGRTFSAAEEFSYNLQCLDRATIVGETSRNLIRIFMNLLRALKRQPHPRSQRFPGSNCSDSRF